MFDENSRWFYAGDRPKFRKFIESNILVENYSDPYRLYVPNYILHQKPVTGPGRGPLQQLNFRIFYVLEYIYTSFLSSRWFYLSLK